MRPGLERQGFRCTLLDNPSKNGGPFLLAERIEDAALPTVLSYGHGDVIRGQEAQWRAGLDPWVLKREGDRLYGRGSADNKGQHTINLRAGGGAENARTPGVQFQAAARDRRGNRFARPRATVRAEQGTPRRRRAHRIGRAAACA
jgi:hypothetical protein